MINLPKTILKQAGIYLLCVSSCLASCNGQSTARRDTSPATISNAVAGEDTAAMATALRRDVRCMLQDRKGQYWFGTNGRGVYRYDEKKLTRFSNKDGLCNDVVWEIQEDAHGNLWFSTGTGICRFNGTSFTDYTDSLKHLIPGKVQYKEGDVLFSYEGDVCRFDGSSFSRFIIYPAGYHPNPADLDRPYGIYCSLEDKSGNLWLGTDHKGACRYDGKSLSWFTAAGLDGAAVRSIFQDKQGQLWFGTNGYGLFRYDGKTLSNFTEEHGLGNPAFLQKKQPLHNTATLARVWAINEDREGNLWIGTIDAGVWRYDGKKLLNYTLKDGLGGNAINAIYKDHNGTLWFVPEQGPVCTFNGTSFVPFAAR